MGTMSIAAKQLLLQEIESSLSSKLTVNDIRAVTDVIIDRIVNYDVERKEDTGECADYQEFLQYFIDAKRIEGRSEKTIAHYKYVLDRLMETIHVPMKEISVYHIRSFIASEKARGISDRTLNNNRQAYNAFFGWLKREHFIPNNPCESLSPIKCMKKVKLPFSDVDIEKLKEACDSARDKALLAFLYATGCRISEVCNLDISNVDMISGECTVLGKGNKERTVFLDPIAVMQLQNYLNTRDNKSNALFTGKGDRRLEPGGVRKRLNELGQKAGVENVHPHRFRRTLATNLIDRGMPIQEVAAILGHDKIDTTMTYVYISKQNVRNSYRKYS